MNEQTQAELPFDQGTEAYRSRLPQEANPYPEGSWQHNEWWDGWVQGNQCDERDSYDWAAGKFKS